MILTKLLKYSSLWTNRKILIAICILLPLHLALVKLSMIFAFPDGTAAIWPSTGLFLSTVLIWGRRFWVTLLICDFIVLQSLLYSNPLLSFCIALLDVSDALVVRWLILRYVSFYPFNRASDAIKFVALLVPYPIFSSATGVIIHCLTGYSTWENFGILWRGWLIGNIMSNLIVTPILLTWFQRNDQRSNAVQLSPSRFYIGELLLIAGILAIVGYWAFWRNISVEYMMILPLLWAAFRFRQREATLLTLLAIAIATAGTAQGHGSFAQEIVARSMILLQSFMSALTVAPLVLAAAVQENRISAAQLHQANDELEERVETRTAELTQTLQQLQTTQAQLIQQEKMSSLGQLVAGVAHEINNPINFIHGNLIHIQTYTQDLLSFVQLHQIHYPNPVAEIQEKAEEMDLEFVQQDLIKILGSMRMGTDRIRQIVLTLRNFSRVDEAEFKAVDIHEGIDSTLLILQHRLKAKSDHSEITVVKKYDKLPLIECYPGQLNQVFMNILANAIDALEEITLTQPSHQPQTYGCITISTLRVDPNRIQIAIADNGIGMTEATRQHIFNPFFTTKPIGKGTGMGMSISHQIITEKHGGRLECHSAPGNGTEFRIQIPIHQS